MPTGKSKNMPRTIRLPIWMDDAINEIADSEGMSYTTVIHDLLRQELAAMGIYRGIGRESALKQQKTAKKTPRKKSG